MSSILKKILFVLILFLLVLPAIQKATGLLGIRPLDGDFILAKKPGFSTSGWFSGTYQEQFDNYIEQNLGLRPLLVRLNNQLDYSLYRHANAEGVTVGKNGYLFESDYIRALQGKDFMGYDFIDKNIRRMKFLQEHLKEAYGIALILVFEPSKARFYQEYLRREHKPDSVVPTNYDAYREAAKRYGLNFLDLNQYYQKLKAAEAGDDILESTKAFLDTLEIPGTGELSAKSFPLYTRNGIHWSLFGAVLMADTMVRFIEETAGLDLPGMWIDSMAVSSVPRSTDNDVSRTMNLLWDPPMEAMAYPGLAFGDTTGKDLPNVLVVGDSYYWNIFNAGLPKHLFGNEAFWYFNAKVYPDTYYGEKWVKDIDMKAEVEKQDVVILTITDRFLFKFDWGFINSLYKIYGPVTDYDRYHDLKVRITSDNNWFADIIKKAQQRNISLEEMLQLDAEYMLMMNDKETYFSIKGPAYFAERIRKDHSWLKQVREKAEERGITEEAMIQKDAEYMFRQNHPEAAERYYRIKALEESIRSDSLAMERIWKEAGKKFLTEEEMVRFWAKEKMIEDRRSKIED